MRFWAYLIATVGFCLGGYLIVRTKHIKHGTWIVCLCLGVVLAGNLNISSLLSVGDAFKYSVSNQVSAISNDLGIVKLVLTQQINNTFNQVTEVRREVADVKELVTGFYSMIRSETIRGTDTNRFCMFQKKDGASVIALCLRETPIRESLHITAIPPEQPASVIPVGHTALRSNVVFLVLSNNPKQCEDMRYSVTYSIDPKHTNIYSSVIPLTNSFLLDHAINYIIR